MSKVFQLSSDSIFHPLVRLCGRVGSESYADRRAAELGDEICFELQIPRRCGVSAAYLRVWNETQGSEHRFPLLWQGMRQACDVYTVKLDSESIGVGLCFLTFVCTTPIGLAYSDRVSPDSFRLTQCDGGSSYQLLISKFAYDMPSSYFGGIVYQIFVDRFARGKNCAIPDGMELVSDWSEIRLEFPEYPGAPMKNNIVYGGNLDGIRQKLDYLQSLGVSLLYLTPIFSSPSNHKYDTANYETIDPLFGDESAFRALIQEAEEKGMGIILDGVFNHTGSDSLYFNQKGLFSSLGAAQSKESPYYPWYTFYSYPDSYECWWNIKILPRINLKEPSCSEYFVGDEGIVSRWASFGISGMRLDVADELPDEFIQRIKQQLVKKNPKAILYGEVWEDASNKIAYDTRKKYYHGDELDGVMNYPLREAVISYLRRGDISAMRYYLDEVMPNTPWRVLHLQMNLIGTHDTPRAITALAGESPEGHANAELFSLKLSQDQFKIGVARLKQAMAILAVMPGLPMIYYGDEVGMQGYSDPFNRLPFPWGKENHDLMSFYQRIGAWRRKRSSLKTGMLTLLRLDEKVMILERKDEKECVILVINRSETTFELPFTKKISNLIGGRRAFGGVETPANGFSIFTV